MQERRAYSEALIWYERAAAQGYPQGINNLAYLHDLGLGTAQNRQKAFELYQQAAERGWAEAMWNLANMYALGQVGPKDNFNACVWTYRADQYATARQDELKRRVAAGIQQLPSMISSEELKRCEQTATDWHPSPMSPSSRIMEPTP